MDPGLISAIIICFIVVIGLSSLMYSLVFEKDIHIIHTKPKPPEYYAPKKPVAKTNYLENETFRVENLK